MRLIHYGLVIGCIFSTQLLYAQPQHASVEHLKTFVSQIVGPMQYPRHGKHPDELDRSAAWLKEQMRLFSIPCDYQNYIVNQKQYRNVVCRLNVGRTDKVIVGAHYDAKFDQHGINDNASGVAAVLETAYLLSQNPNKLKHNVDFVFYTLSTPPYRKSDNMGSLRHAKSIAQEKETIQGVYIFDEIGFYDTDAVQEYPQGLNWLYPSHANFIAAASDLNSRQLASRYCQSMRDLDELECEQFSLPIVNIFEYSDHQSYWKYDIPAILITDTGTYRNKNRYRAEVEFKRLNYEKMAAVVNGMIFTLQEQP